MEHFPHFQRHGKTSDSDTELPGVYTPCIEDSTLNTGSKPEATERNP